MKDVFADKGAERRMLVALRFARRDVDAVTSWLEKVNRELSKAHGLRSIDILRQDSPGTADFFVLVRFVSLDALEDWKRSPARAELLGPLEALATLEIARQEGQGACVWFEPIALHSAIPAVPPFWKRWVVSMVAVYPALMALIFALAPVTNGLPRPLGLFIVALVLTGLTTGYIAPTLTRRLGPWLAASERAAFQQELAKDRL